MDYKSLNHQEFHNIRIEFLCFVVTKCDKDSLNLLDYSIKSILSCKARNDTRKLYADSHLCRLLFFTIIPSVCNDSFFLYLETAISSLHLLYSIDIYRD